MGIGRPASSQQKEHSAEIQLDPRGKRLYALGKTLEVARQIALGGPLALEAAIRAVKAPGGPSEVAENVAYDSLLHTEDRMEALKAFGEKRVAKFKGR